MRALVLTHQNGFGGLTADDLPAPEPDKGQVSIDVKYAGVGLIDAFWVSGVIPSNAGFVPGLEVSGTVRALGGGVTGFAVGQKVAALLPGAGGFAEIACTPATLVAAIPPGLSIDLASVIPINTVTAHLALTTVSRFSPGESLLIHAGVGGLGSQFAQVARALGAGRVDAVVGTSAKQGIARELGYDQSYLRSELAAIQADTYDVVIDPVGGAATETGFRVLRGGGRLVRVGNASQANDVALSSMAHWLENKTTAGFNVGGWLADRPGEGAASLRWALEAVARGDVRVDLTRVGGINEIPDLLAALERGDTTGKLAVRMAIDPLAEIVP
ncbi:zinc-binding dehydrogenase [Paenarthrobacter nicotinovorans]|uniref:quinone oxidoreductase family protein n=1 Tax=Paenarthrobacter nicotinovorans TaxID=29320 RepID=UPI0011A4A72B|nr:zinc-binding dehydrogenase [Paenarthrobacter nicotinovorans]